MLVDLVVENASVRVFQFCSVDVLLLKLLLSLNLAPLVLHSLERLFLFLPLLLWHCEGVHVLGVNLVLLVDGCFLVSQVPLLVGVERVVCDFCPELTSTAKSVSTS